MLQEVAMDWRRDQVALWGKQGKKAISMEADSVFRKHTKYNMLPSHEKLSPGMLRSSSTPLRLRM